MPELPEVEAARRAVEANCLNKKIVKATIADDSKVIDKVTPAEFEAAIVGKTIVAARRKGKNMWLQLDSPPFPTFQFGMAGAIYIKGIAVTQYKRSAVNDADEWPSKYSKFLVELEDGLELSFTDKRRFARVRLLEDPTAVPPISELGPDALFEPMTVDEFTESLSKKKIAIKPLLLDQSYISGIGNWIADEVLYQARIHPQQIASTLSKESCATLHKCIKEVIEKAVEVGADSNQYPESWLFHSREKKPGKAFVDGKKIDFITSGGRTTAYVPELQKLTGGQAAKAGGKNKQTAKRKQSGQDSDAEESASEKDIAEKANSKKGLKTRGEGKNPPRQRKSKDDDPDDNDDGDSDEDTIAAGLKKIQKLRGRGKRPQTKSKPKGGFNNSSNDDSDDNNADGDEEASVAKSKKGPKSRGQSKKLAAKRKLEENDDAEDNSDDEHADADNEEGGGSHLDKDQKKTGKAVGSKKRKSETISNKKVPTTQTSRNLRKKAK